MSKEEKVSGKWFDKLIRFLNSRCKVTMQPVFIPRDDVPKELWNGLIDFWNEHGGIGLGTVQVGEFYLSWRHGIGKCPLGLYVLKGEE